MAQDTCSFSVATVLAVVKGGLSTANYRVMNDVS